MAILKSTLWKNKYDNFDIGYKQYGGGISKSTLLDLVRKDNNDNIDRIRNILKKYKWKGKEIINYQDPNSGKTALMYAVENGNKDIVKLLLKYAERNIKDKSGKTALRYAVENGNSEIVDLFKYGAKRPLINALENGDFDTARELIKDGYKEPRIIDRDFSYYSDKALKHALENRYYDIAYYLIENKCSDANVQDNNGKTALMYAIENGDFDTAHELLRYEYHYNPNIKDNNGKTVLIYAIENGDFDTARELLQDKIVSPKIKNDKDNNGKTALMYAIEKDDKDIVKLLIERGARLYAQDNNGKTALMYAVEKEDRDIVNLLLNNKIRDGELQPKFDILSALFKAIEYGDIECVKTLLQTGINPDLQDINNGNTALIWATRSGKYDIVKLLIDDYYVNPDIQNNNGKTALDIAKINKDQNIAELINNYKYKRDNHSDNGYVF